MTAKTTLTCCDAKNLFFHIFVFQRHFKIIIFICLQWCLLPISNAYGDLCQKEAHQAPIIFGSAKKPVLILHIPHLSTWVSKMIPSWGFIHVRKQRLGNIFRHSYTHYPHMTYPCSHYKKIGKADKIKILFVGWFLIWLLFY